MDFVHYVFFCTEDVSAPLSAEQMAAQLAWMKADLAAVNRDQTPWVVAVGHKYYSMDTLNWQPYVDVLNPGGEGSQVEGQGGSIPGLPTVVSLVQRAGGITLNANLGDVRLRRRIPGDSNQLREVQLNLVSLLQQGDKRQNPFLFDGDTLLISRAPAPPPDVVLELAATNLSPQSIQVNIVGEVKGGGRISLPAGTPLMQAILAAGGVDRQRANRSNIELVRINRNGTATLRRYNLDFSQGVSGPRNPPLRDGDSVIVNRSVLATGSDAINTITTPFTGLVNILALMQVLRDIGNDNNNN